MFQAIVVHGALLKVFFFFNKFGDVSCLVIEFDTADTGFLVRAGMPLDPLQELQDRALYGWVWAQV